MKIDEEFDLIVIGSGPENPKCIFIINNLQVYCGYLWAMMPFTVASINPI